jgi:hypothetical protein
MAGRTRDGHAMFDLAGFIRMWLENADVIDAERVRDELEADAGASAEIGIYRLLCRLTGRTARRPI